MKEKKYVLIPKNKKGCIWYMDQKELFKGNLVKVSDSNGFETVVDIRNYDICK